MVFFWIIALILYASWHGAWDEFYFAQEDNVVGVGGVVTNYTSGLEDYQAHIYTNTAETNFVVPDGSLTVDLLMVAGGGGGGDWSSDGGAGGGGGGGVILTNLTLSTGTYTVQVGEGGAADFNGSNTIFHTLTAIGGGHGASCYSHAGDGGSGGGGAADRTRRYGGAGTTGQGNDGGDGGSDKTYGKRGGGGGGYGSIGLSYTDARPNGGAGITNDFSGVEKGYGGGGGGYGASDQHFGFGLDGGGDGGPGSFWGGATAGEDSTGGGGGGGYDGDGGKGGSGIVIIRYVVD